MRFGQNDQRHSITEYRINIHSSTGDADLTIYLPTPFFKEKNISKGRNVSCGLEDISPWGIVQKHHGFEPPSRVAPF